MVAFVVLELVSSVLNKFAKRLAGKTIFYI